MTQRKSFGSDNHAGAHPEVLRAMMDANSGDAVAYGADEWTERAVAALQALREGGVGVSIDDFGTGNASIEYLATLPASELKIDRSFITGMLEDARAEAIARSTIDLARNLGLTVVAEGIETEAVMEHLAGLGAQTGQGYFISRPLPAAELTAQLIAAFGIVAERELVA